jgi:hypothetical protein
VPREVFEEVEGIAGVGLRISLVTFVAALTVGAEHQIATAQAKQPSFSKPAASVKAGAVPRTPDGHPDFQGLWDYRTVTPLERPRDLAPDKTVFTDEEAAAFERRNQQRLDNVIAVHPPGWLDYGSKVLADRRTALIVDPPNGRVPPLTPEARTRVAANTGERARRR